MSKILGTKIKMLRYPPRPSRCKTIPNQAQSELSNTTLDYYFTRVVSCSYLLVVCGEVEQQPTEIFAELLTLTTSQTLIDN
jgi:hypothetical protein